jgi:transcriptional regulator with XRE-family HTH domain
MTQGRRFRAARLAAKLTQKQVAKRIRVGKSTVSAWEKGVQFPRRKALRRFARLTNTEITVFYA